MRALCLREQRWWESAEQRERQGVEAILPQGCSFSNRQPYSTHCPK